MPSTTAFGPPNTVRLAKRFFWKECRRLAGLAAGLAVVVVLTMLFVKTVSSSPMNVDGLLAVIAAGGGAMLAVAAAVTLFSVEKEEGTTELLNRLPRNASAVSLGKIAAAVAVVALTTAALALVALVLAAESPGLIDIRLFAQQGSLFLAEAFVWGLVASLLCPNPLVAAVLGIAAASASGQLAIWVGNPNAYGYTPEAFIQASSQRITFVSIAALVAGGLASRWPAPLTLRRSHQTSRAAATFEERTPLLQRLPLGLFGRYCWQTVRQSWAIALVATLLGAFLTGMSLLTVVGLLNLRHGWMFVVGFSALFAPALLGAVVFRADQRRDAYRFLAEHAGRPRTLWLARNTVGLAMLAALLAVVLTFRGWLLASDFLAIVGNGWNDNTSPGVEALRMVQAFFDLRRTLLVGASAAFAAYALGQFLSLTVRSDVIAAMLALVVSALVAGWAMAVLAWRLPPLAFLLPIGFGALLASLLRVPDWMFERRGVWRWAAPLAVLAAPVALLAALTPAVRLDQVAEKPPTIWFGKDNFATIEGLVNQTREELLEGREVADAYKRLEAENVTSAPVEDGSPDEYFGSEVVSVPVGGRFEGEAFDEFLRLSRIKCRIPTRRGTLPKPGDDLQTIVLVESPDAAEPIDLDGRLERLLACRRVAAQQINFSLLQHTPNDSTAANEIVEWATAEGQSSRRLLEAIRGLREAEAMLVGPIGQLINTYVDAKAVLTGETPPQFMQVKNANPSGEQLLAYLSHDALGFERRRALKALEILAAFDAAYLANGLRTLASPVPALDVLNHHEVDDAQLVARLPYENRRRVGSHLDDLRALADARTSYLASMEYNVYHNTWRLPQSLRDWVGGVAWRRAERVRLALIAYRLDHDGYPDDLVTLTPDYVPEADVRDPYTNHPFGWAAEGFELPVAIRNGAQNLLVDSTNPGTPMLWCLGLAAAPPVEVLATRAPPDVMGFGRRSAGSEVNAQEAVEDEEVPAMSLRIGGSFWMPVPKSAGAK